MWVDGFAAMSVTLYYELDHLRLLFACSPYGEREDGLVIKGGVTMVAAVDDKVDLAARENCGDHV